MKVQERGLPVRTAVIPAPLLPLGEDIVNPSRLAGLSALAPVPSTKPW